MIALTFAEGEALRALDALLGGEAGPRGLGVTAAGVRGTAVMAVGARRMARAAVRWLVHGGGWRHRALLRGGRRARGRAWDAHLSSGFTLRFTAASEALWTQSIEVIPALRIEEDPEARRALRHRLRGAPHARGSGDHIVAALALGARLGLAGEDERARIGGLRAHSPLAALLRPDAPLTETAPNALRAMLSGTEVRIFECAQDRLAEAWLDGAVRAMAIRDTHAATRAWEALASILRAWCDVVEGGRRMDLARPALVAVTRIAEALADGGLQGARARLVGGVGVRAIGSRDSLFEAVGGVLAVGTQLLDRRAALAQERYGDDRYEESQVFLAEVDATLAPRRATLQGLSRALSSSVG